MRRRRRGVTHFEALTPNQHWSGTLTAFALLSVRCYAVDARIGKSASVELTNADDRI